MSVGFSKNLAKHLLGKVVEVSQGIEHNTTLQSDRENRHKSVIRGKLLEIDEELIIILYTNIQTGQSNKVYINSWSVQSVVEPMNGISMADVYSQDQDRRKLTKQLKTKKPTED